MQFPNKVFLHLTIRIIYQEITSKLAPQLWYIENTKDPYYGIHVSCHYRCGEEHLSKASILKRKNVG